MSYELLLLAFVPAGEDVLDLLSDFAVLPVGFFLDCGMDYFGDSLFWKPSIFFHGCNVPQTATEYHYTKV